MHKATTFEHDGKVYEVRAIPTLNGWKVRIFVEGVPANGFTYSVDSEVYQDAAIDGVPEDLVAGLMETAERDFRRGLAQELVAIKPSRNFAYLKSRTGDVPSTEMGCPRDVRFPTDSDRTADIAGGPKGANSRNRGYKRSEKICSSSNCGLDFAC
jgi:hypothetical protein